MLPFLSCLSERQMIEHFKNIKNNRLNAVNRSRTNTTIPVVLSARRASAKTNQTGLQYSLGKVLIWHLCLLHHFPKYDKQLPLSRFLAARARRLCQDSAFEGVLFNMQFHFCFFFSQALCPFSLLFSQ